MIAKAGSALSLRARPRPGVRDVGIDGVVVACNIPGQPGLFAVLLRVVVLLAVFEQAVLTRVIVLADLGGIVSGPGRMLCVARLARLVRGLGGLVELLVAGAVLVPATFPGHCSLSVNGPKKKATLMPVPLGCEEALSAKADLR
ncbi:MAG: hypothetical protein ABR543_14870 [Gemmatimonadaceae bacterium]